MINPIVQQIYDTDHIVNGDGETVLLEYEVSLEDGKFLQSLIHERSWISQTLEIGCAYGMSSLFICGAIEDRPNPRHVIIDPNQSTEFYSTGVAHLQRMGYDFYELFEEKSEFVLPRMVEQEQKFDLIFIDGWHTLDQVMVDVFYATSLLRPNGILVLHDCWMPSVSRIVSYLRHYPCYREIGAVSMAVASTARTISNSFVQILPAYLGKRLLPSSLYYRMYNNQTVVAFEKVETDARSWDWYREF